MKKTKIANGLFWVSIPEVDLRIQCGCPADSVKHLMKMGFISSARKGKVTYETGPNVILLSDTPIQHGMISNLAEFPVLQMLYRQGMLLPGHPNNTGRKPLLAGAEDQVRAQSQYIFRGNYGLCSREELMRAGVSEAEAREMMRIKLRFAFEKIRPTDELLDLLIIGRQNVRIAPGVTIRRKGTNRFQIRHGAQSVEVDLNLAPEQGYGPPYALKPAIIKREQFSIIHMGEGDGWNFKKPCMGSMVCFRGKLYLIDAGPDIRASLVALGVTVADLEGIFQTHVHDDHFAGFTSLMATDRKLKYYATPYVRATAEKKLTALIGMRPGEFNAYFEVHDLTPGRWNSIDGLEVKPLYSPHPVETTVLFFRAASAGGSRTYAHLADIIDFGTLHRMVHPGVVSRELHDAYTSALLAPVDVKKIDVGGGLIHGTAEDFRDDASRVKYLSHKTGNISAKEKEIGTVAAFGSQDVLIPASEDLHARPAAARFLSACFPAAPLNDIEMLASCPIVTIRAGTTIMRPGERTGALALIIDGVADSREPRSSVPFMVTSGTLIGEMCALTGDRSRRTYRARSFVTALRIPLRMYVDFVERNGLRDQVLRVHENRRFLQSTWLFGEMVSPTVGNRIAHAMTRETAAAGCSVRRAGEPQLAVLEKGKVSLSTGGRHFATLGPGDFWGEAAGLQNMPSLFEAVAERACSYFLIPADALGDIPIVQWKLMETFRRRLFWFRTHATLEWTEEYALGARTDGRQKRLFEVVRNLADCMERTGMHGMCSELASEVEKEGSRLFAEQESLMRKRRFPELEHHREEHERMLSQIRRLDDEKGLLEETRHRSVRDFLKDWVLTHTILEDLKLRAFLSSRK
jgi:hemerythrin